jgi:hypothetical protein
MLSKRILAVMLVLLAGLTACEEDSVSPPPDENPKWWLEPDSMNLGILVLDYLTYEFEGGRVDHFALCDTCDRDSLPLEQTYEPPNDVGNIVFRYSGTQDTVLHATEVWAGTGRIKYPREFLPPSDFARTVELPSPPLSIEYYHNSGKTELYAEADTAWFRVRGLDVVKEFATEPYRVGIYWHRARAAVWEPGSDSWVVFLYRGRISER